jgi:methylated-DNA-protein-cysteine methyltransferase-like protein
MVGQTLPKAFKPIWEVVSRIPTGCVLTYGEVAKRAGFPRGARQVSTALHAAPARLKLPWHRVVGAGGRISLPADSPDAARQIARLKREGWTLRGLQLQAADNKSLDELLWGP